MGFKELVEVVNFKSLYRPDNKAMVEFSKR